MAWSTCELKLTQVLLLVLISDEIPKSKVNSIFNKPVQFQRTYPNATKVHQNKLISYQSGIRQYLMTISSVSEFANPDLNILAQLVRESVSLSFLVRLQKSLALSNVTTTQMFIVIRFKDTVNRYICTSHHYPW